VAAANELRLKNISKDTLKVLIEDFPYDMYSGISTPNKFLPSKGEMVVNVQPLY